MSGIRDIVVVAGAAGLLLAAGCGDESTNSTTPVAGDQRADAQETPDDPTPRPDDAGGPDDHSDNRAIPPDDVDGPEADAAADAESPGNGDSPPVAVRDADARLRDGWLRTVGGDVPRAQRDGALAALDEDRDASIAHAVEQTGSGPVEVRRGAAGYLALHVEAHPDARAALIQALSDGDDEVRHTAVQGLRQLSAADLFEAVAPLADLLDPDREEATYRVVVARMLGGLGEAGSEAVPALAQALATDPDPQVRTATLHAVIRTASPEQSAPALQTAMLEDDEPRIRRLAAVELRQLGVFAPEMARDFTRALGDDDDEVRVAAVDGLLQFGPAAVPALREALKDPQTRRRFWALYTLGQIGTAARDAAPEIRPLLEDDHEQVRRMAEVVLRVLERDD